jgi:acetyl-CoA synthetase
VKPINPEAWVWYHRYIGGERCPGRRHLVANGNRRDHDHAAARPHDDEAWIGDASVSRHTAEIKTDKGENGAGRRWWPARADAAVALNAARDIWRSGSVTSNSTGAVGRLISTSPATVRKRDTDGFFWLLGRVDDCAERGRTPHRHDGSESALVDHPRVAEAAVVGRPHEIKGQAVAAFVTLKEGTQGSEILVGELKDHVVKKIGAIARPDDVIFAADLPKTRSGKIMRRLLRDIAEESARRYDHTRRSRPSSHG